MSSDFLVVCGGPKQAVDSSQAKLFYNEQKEPKFTYIVEASDDYLTSYASEYFFHNNALVFTNTSTQKGLVTSSSMEILCYLALGKTEYEKFV